MKRKEILEKIRVDVLKSIQNSDLTSEEISRIIDKIVNQFMGIFENHNCNYREIEEYLIQNKNYVKIDAGKMCEERKGEILQQIDHSIKNLESEMQENLEKTDKKEQEIEDKRKISDITTDDRKDINRVLVKLTDLLRDAQIQATRILVNRGYSDIKIQEIRHDLTRCINIVENDQVLEIQQVLQTDKQQIINKIVYEYEENMGYIATEEKKQDNRSLFRSNTQSEAEISIENTKSEEDERLKFKEELDSGKTLQEQKDFADKIIEKNSENVEGKTNRKLLQDMFR